MRTVISGDGRSHAALDDDHAAILQRFDGVQLDPQAAAAIQAALEDCAARHRDADAFAENGSDEAIATDLDDTRNPFVPLPETSSPYQGNIELPYSLDEFQPFTPGEDHWRFAGAEIPEHYREALDRMNAASAVPHIAEVKRRKPGKRREPAAE